MATAKGSGVRLTLARQIREKIGGKATVRSVQAVLRALPEVLAANASSGKKVIVRKVVSYTFTGSDKKRKLKVFTNKRDANGKPIRETRTVEILGRVHCHVPKSLHSALTAPERAKRAAAKKTRKGKKGPASAALRARAAKRRVGKKSRTSRRR